MNAARTSRGRPMRTLKLVAPLVPHVSLTLLITHRGRNRLTHTTVGKFFRCLPQRAAASLPAYIFARFSLLKKMCTCFRARSQAVCRYVNRSACFSVLHRHGSTWASKTDRPKDEGECVSALCAALLLLRAFIHSVTRLTVPERAQSDAN